VLFVAQLAEEATARHRLYLHVEKLHRSLKRVAQIHIDDLIKLVAVSRCLGFCAAHSRKLFRNEVEWRNASKLCWLGVAGEYRLASSKTTKMRRSSGSWDVSASYEETMTQSSKINDECQRLEGVEI